MRLSSLSSPLLIASFAAFVVSPLACAQAVREIDSSSGSDTGGDGGTWGSGGNTQGGNGGQGGAQGGAGGQGGQGAGMTDAGPDANPNDACANKPDFTPCEDGLFCTQNDLCIAGQCTSGSSKICPSNGNACQIGSCNEATNACELAPVNQGGSCEDGDPCTELGTCSFGTCLPGQTKDCSFLDGTCAVGKCDPVKGCVVVPQNDGSFCDDNQFCTVNDACSAGACVGKPNPCGAPNNVCMIAACDEINKTCTAVAGNNGAACNDGNACTGGETCSAGACVGGMPANQGVSCNDNNACTLGESCVNGGCGGGTQVLACKNGDGCCPLGCDAVSDDDCKQLRVGVMNGGFYTDGLRAHLESQQFIESAVTVNDCSLATLQQYDVVILYGNMNCFDPASFNAYVQGGGGLIATPWIFNNNQGIDCLPVMGSSLGSEYSFPLDVTVTNPADVLLQGVAFQNGDLVGWETWSFTLKPGATSAVVWQNDPNKHAVAKWTYGMGRAVYLDFHYITSDCTSAINYPWGKQLAYNATLWAGKAL